MRGISGLVSHKRRKYPNKTKAKQDAARVLEIFHNQPRTYGINRASWTGLSLAEAFQREYQESISAGTARRHLRNSGYTMRRARQVLTSTDPAYREKVELLSRTLGSLRPDELLFFVDEMGPIRVKKHGGRIYTKKGATKTFPQVQSHRGAVSLAGALSATTNQVTAFFCKAKDSNTMVDLIELLFNQHIDKSRIYITWDAASWHSSHELVSWLDEFNEVTGETETGPIVEFIPLPTCAQFLDVIEAVFGGMKKAVIHHSDYANEEEMKTAIARHFEERNEYFRRNPKRAGKKIWTLDFFSDHDSLVAENYKEW
jgi:hypothetical protein